MQADDRAAIRGNNLGNDDNSFEPLVWSVVALVGGLAVLLGAIVYFAVA